MSNNVILITGMSPADVADIKSLETDGGLAVWHRSDYLNEINRRDSVCLIARFRRQIVGFAIMRLIMSQERSGCFDEAELYSLSVKTEFRRRGIAAKLLTECMERAKKKGVGNIWLEVRASNLKASEFYEGRGFEIVHRRRNYYQLPSDDALVMRLKLNNET